MKHVITAACSNYILMMVAILALVALLGPYALAALSWTLSAVGSFGQGWF